MGYNLPICKDAEEKDVTYSCFKRDSPKDQIIVWSFILGTAALLGCAGVNKVLELRKGRSANVGGMGGVFGALGGSRNGGEGRGSGLLARGSSGTLYSPSDGPGNGEARGTG